MDIIGDPRPAGTTGPAGDQRPAGTTGPAGDPRPAGNTATYDPADHTATEVNAHLADATPDEHARILDAEKHGKNRATIG